MIAQLKENIDLADYVRSTGITLTKHGSRDLKGLCPFHDDKNPSMIITPSKQLFNCPVCNTGGSVIDFASKIKNISIGEAVKELAEDNNITASDKENKIQINPLEAIQDATAILERTVSFYEKTFSEKLGGKEYLESRGISDAGLFTKHRLGYANGSLLNALPKEGKVLEELVGVGVLVKLKSGKYIERFLNCVVFPVYDTELNITTLYARNCKDDPERRHLYLPNRPTGLFNASAMKSYPEIILVESCIDALSLETAGIHNAVSIMGTNGVTAQHIDLFKEHGVEKITLLLDGDNAGIKASKALTETLSESFETNSIPLPTNYDPNEYLTKYGTRSLISLIANSPKIQIGESISSKQISERMTGLTPSGFSLSFGVRNYELIGLEKKPRSLKATVRVSKSGKIHVDTIDFYSSRQRRQLSQDICNTFEELPDTITNDIEKLLKECEAFNPEAVRSPDSAKKENILTAGEIKKAENFGRSPKLIENILRDFETCGLIGEENNKLISYLAMTSRKMKEPLSVLILSSSGAGKSALQDGALAFCPPEDLVKLTSLSAKALFYKEQTSLKHKVLAIEEGAGAEEATYAIRNLISSGGLTSEVAVRDPASGKLTTMSNTVEGPLAVFCTTTNPEVDPETKSRFLVTGIDESREQTRKILDFQRKRHTISGLQKNIEKDKVLALHRNFQRLLSNVVVVNPHVNELSYSDDRLQGRRAQPQYLNIISSVAYLRQMQKVTKVTESLSKVGEKSPAEVLSYIEVDKIDIEIGNKLAVEILGKTLDELSIPARNLLELIDTMLTRRLNEIRKTDTQSTLFKKDLTFTRRELREFTGWARTRTQIHLKELVEMEYIYLDSGRSNSLQYYKFVYEGEGESGKKFIPGLKKDD